MDRNEIRRLQKAARDNNKLTLAEWGNQFENQIRDELNRKFKVFYDNEVQEAIDNFCIIIAYTFMFSEHTNIKADDLADFMSDLFATVDLYSKGEFNMEEYTSQMEEEGVDIKDLLNRRHNK